MATRNESDSAPPATAPPQVAILIGNGVDGAMVRAMCAVLRKACVWPRLVGQRLGAVASLDACPLQVETTFAGMPPVLLGGVIMPDGAELAGTLGADPKARDFLRQAHRLGKPLLGVGDGVEVLVAAGAADLLPDGASHPRVIMVDGGASDAGLRALLDALAISRARSPGTSARSV